MTWLKSFRSWVGRWVVMPAVGAGALVIGLVLVALWLIGWWLAPPTPKPGDTTTHPPKTPNSATVEHIVNPTDLQRQLLEAQAREAQLWEELKTLRSSLDAMTKAVATLRSSGTGKFVPVPGPAGPAGEPGQPGAPGEPGKFGAAVTPLPTRYAFTDWRLSFVGDTATQQASYTLAQRFEITHITGRQRDGTPTSLMRMVEIGPAETRTPVPMLAKTVVIDETRNHWFWAPTIQAGYAMSWPMSTSTLRPSGTRAHGALVSVQLWRRGLTKAAEDCSLAIASPVVFLSQDVKAIGLAPIGVNLGRLKHQPFKDIWVSPFVVFDPRVSLFRVGAGVSASF